MQHNKEVEMGDIQGHSRIDKIEDALRKTQDSMLLMGKDVHSMNLSITSIAKSMETLVELQQNMKLMEERAETRHQQLKDADKTIHIRLDSLHSRISDAAGKADNGERAYSILVSIAKWLGASAVTVLVGLFVYVIQLQGAK
jgi:hypothetical protein